MKNYADSGGGGWGGGGGGGGVIHQSLQPLGRVR